MWYLIIFLRGGGGGGWGSGSRGERLLGTRRPPPRPPMRPLALHLAPPPESDHVRVDTGVEQGDAITPHYDPMIAKLIVWDATRDAVLARMRQALAARRG